MTHRSLIYLEFGVKLLMKGLMCSSILSLQVMEAFGVRMFKSDAKM